jgi:FMN phosphatase YigB (HAD superfamily)
MVIELSKIRVVLFDVDNTLLDFMRMKTESCRAAVHAMVSEGLRMSEVQAYESLMDTYFDVGIESDTAFAQFLRKEGQFDYKLLAAAINSYLDKKSRCQKPYPNVKAVLSRLKKRGITLAVVTDAPKTKAYQRLLRLKVVSYFKFVVSYEDTNSQKKTSLPLLYALDLLKKELPDIKPDEVLMVGDSVERDIAPAGKLGFQTALATYGQTRDGSGSPTFELTDFKDLLTIV